MGRWLALQPLSERDRELLSRRFTIDFNYNSNHIEGNTLTYGQTEITTTGTNVSVIFFDKSAQADKVILIDASKLGEEHKEGNNQKRRLRDFEVDKIVCTFQNKESAEDFSAAVTYDEIKEKGYSLSARQYFDIKIDYVGITEEEFNNRMASYRTTLQEQFAESHRLEDEILKQLNSIKFNENVGRE